MRKKSAGIAAVRSRGSSRYFTFSSFLMSYSAITMPHSISARGEHMPLRLFTQEETAPGSCQPPTQNTRPSTRAIMLGLSATPRTISPALRFCPAAPGGVIRLSENA